MENHNISYFRQLYSSTVEEMQHQCDLWTNTSSDNSIPEEVEDEIRTTVGLANLLMNQKLKQFHGLIDDSEFNRGEKEITCLDLQGFWDMVYNEVEKIQNGFKKLKQCQESNWVFVEEKKLLKSATCKKPLLAKTVKNVIAAKGHAQAARQRLAEAKMRMKAHRTAEKESTGVLIAERKNVLDVVPPVTIISAPVNDSLPLSHDIANHQIAKLKRDTPSKDTSKVNKGDKSSRSETHKENLKNANSPKLNKKVDTTPNKNGREFIPLQCITRSAKKKLLEAQNK